MLLVLDRYLKNSGRAHQVSNFIPPPLPIPYALYKSGRTRLKILHGDGPPNRVSHFELSYAPLAQKMLPCSSRELNGLTFACAFKCTLQVWLDQTKKYG